VASGALVVDRVTVEFGGVRALDEVSLTAGPGEVVGVIGPNGAGKTTLFNVVCGFVRPDGGTLHFDGRPLRRHRPHDLAGLGIARTLQGVGLFPGLTVLENVMAGATTKARSGFASSLFGLGRSSADERRLAERARRALDELRVSEWAGRLPGALPYAVQKRVALARALVCDPVLLLLDEPASGLSEPEMDGLGALVRRLRRRGMGVVLVEHHMDLVMSVCDRLVVLDFGRVIARGTPVEVKADPVVARAYLGEDAASVDVDLSVVAEGPPPAAAGPGAQPEPVAPADGEATGDA
jgi:branched-chain amino acid transport system ATP-binding protein